MAACGREKTLQGSLRCRSSRSLLVFEKGLAVRSKIYNEDNVLRFLKPEFGGCCFADIPTSIRNWLTGSSLPGLRDDILSGFQKTYDRVICIVIDSLGWHNISPHFETSQVLKEISDQGRVVRLSTQFPSTTAVNITTFHTGLPVAETGILEWFYYDPGVDDIITPFLYQRAKQGYREQLRDEGYSPSTILPAPVFYLGLNDAGLESQVIQPREFSGSTYSEYILQGANVHPYITLSEGLLKMAQLVGAEPRPGYFTLYFPAIDSLSHQHGPSAEAVRIEIELVLHILDRFLRDLRRRRPANTLLLITADHGHIGYDPKDTIYLNRDPRFADCDRFFRRSGRTFPVGGFCRDVQLFIEPDLIDEAEEFFSVRAEGVAEVKRTQDMINEGYFGAVNPSRRFQERAPELFLLPFKNETVWWFDEEVSDLAKNRGVHGGLTALEMEIPLLICEV